MKKMVLLTLIFFNVMVGSAQYYENLYVGIGTPSVENYCDNENLMGFIVHGELNCENHWFVYGEVFHNDTVINTYSYEYEDLDSIIIQNHRFAAGAAFEEIAIAGLLKTAGKHYESSRSYFGIPFGRNCFISGCT